MSVLCRISSTSPTLFGCSLTFRLLFPQPPTSTYNLHRHIFTRSCSAPSTDINININQASQTSPNHGHADSPTTTATHMHLYCSGHAHNFIQSVDTLLPLLSDDRHSDRMQKQQAKANHDFDYPHGRQSIDIFTDNGGDGTFVETIRPQR